MFKNKITFTCNYDLDENNKKINIKMPKEWQNLTKSKKIKNYNKPAILCGKINDLLVIDFDKGSDDIFEQYKNIDTLMDKSVSGEGYHMYFKYDEDFKHKIKNNGYNIDILTDKNCCYLSNNYINNNSINIIPKDFKEFLLMSPNQNNQNIIIDENLEININNDFKFEDLDKVKDLVKILTIKESDNRDDWIKVGMCLKNILEDKDEAKDIWDDFSSLSNKYKTKEIREKWNTFNKDGKLTIGTLCHYAKEYKIKFAKWNKKYNNQKNREFDISNNKLNRFDINDDYNFYDLKDYLFNNLFNDKENINNNLNNLINYLNENLYKVCVRVGDNMIIKLPKDEYKNINQIEQLNGKWRSENKVKYLSLNNNGIPELYKITLKDFLELYPKLINSFKKLNTDFINDTTKFKDDEFYVSQPFPTKYINIEDRDEEKLNYWFNYIKEVICNNDEICYNYFNQLLGFIINNPNQKSGKAIGLIGKQGCGKSTLVEFLSTYIFGLYNSKPNLVGFDDLLKNFNDDLLGKKFICINEMANKKDSFRSNFDKMKSLITDKDLSINKKFMDSFDTKQSFEFILCSNNLNSLNIEDNDRRYFLLQVNDKYMQNNEYFGELRNNIMNQDIANMIYSYYLDLNVGSEFHKLVLPETNLKKELKELSKQSPELYIDYLRSLEDITNIIHDYKLINDIYRYKASSVFSNFKEWCELNNEKFNFGQTKFTSYIKNNCNVEVIRPKETWYII